MSIKFLKRFYNFQATSPTTYEVSAPVPSHLAYSARISYQQPIQYAPLLALNKIENPKQTTFRLFPYPEELEVYQEPQAPQVYPKPQIYPVHPQYQFTVAPQQPVTYFERDLKKQLDIIPGVIYSEQNEIPQAPTLREFKNSPPPNIAQKVVNAPSPVQVLISFFFPIKF